MFYDKKVSGILECTQLYLSSYLECQSINFKLERKTGKKKLCQLNNMTRITSPNKFVTDEDFNYLEPVQVVCSKFFKLILVWIFILTVSVAATIER